MDSDRRTVPSWKEDVMKELICSQTGKLKHCWKAQTISFEGPKCEHQSKKGLSVCLPMQTAETHHQKG